MAVAMKLRKLMMLLLIYRRIAHRPLRSSCIRYSCTTTINGSTAMPFLTFAQGAGIMGLIGFVSEVVQNIIPLLMGIAVLFFLFNLAMFLFSKDPEKQGDARKYMIAGILTLFVMVSVWGLVNLVGSLVFQGDTSDRAPFVPRVPVLIKE